MRPSLVNDWLPNHCLLCGLPSAALNVCRGCRADLPWVLNACVLCGDELPAACAGAECGHCRIELGCIAAVRTALVYRYPVDRLVTHAKFRSRPEYARALGELLGLYLRSASIRGSLQRPAFLVPVPLHRRRLIRRGFNQAEEIARPVATQLGVRSLPRGCRRAVNTIEQTSLDGDARRKNIRGAFEVLVDVDGACVAIVDDVVTTGSTVVELARALRAAGAAEVLVWAATRAAIPPSAGR
ncbi:MAG: ComF family protein [Gammaproteobacteria bacterium]|nr:ComF family protein [Gammaproteobacteria bacterium]